MSLTPLLVSVSSEGENANNRAFILSVSEDGRFAVFGTEATNIVSESGRGSNTYLRDTLLGTTRLINIGPEGEIGSGSDYRSIATQVFGEPEQIVFTTEGFGDGFNFYFRDMSEPTSDLLAPDISRFDYPLDTAAFERWHIAHFSTRAEDGRTIAFASNAEDLVPGDVNGRTDLFLLDLQTREITLVSTLSDGTQFDGSSYQPVLSRDGTKLAFHSFAANIMDGDTNDDLDVFVKDLLTNEITLITNGLNGAPANGPSVVRAFSQDGRYVLFDSEASNLVEGDTEGRNDVFVKDLVTGETIRLSETAEGVGGNGNSFFGAFVADTNVVSFVTLATNLLEGDVNRARDVVYTEIGSSAFVTLDFSGPIQPNNDVRAATASGDGNFAFLTTEATNLVPEDRSSLDSVVRVPLSQVLGFFQLRGDDLPNEIIGDDRIDFLQGFGGNDILEGSGADDLIEGGDGRDIARFSGQQDAYTVSVSQNGVTVRDRQADRDGTDELSGVEVLEFQDTTWDLSLFDDAALLSPEDFRTFAEMYIAYFDRAPDAEGLAFWASALHNGVPLEDIAALFFDQTETRALYPDLSNFEVFAAQVYENVLGRSFDQAGLDFWVGALQSGGVSLEAFVLEIIRGAKAPAEPGASADFIAQKAADVAYLSDKTDLGIYYSVTLGMNDVPVARLVMELFDGTQTGLELSRELIDGVYLEATDPTNGDFLLPIVGVLNNPFEI